MIGSVWQYVCLSVCMLSSTFLGMEWPKELALGIIVEYRSEKKPIDLEVNRYIFKVTVDKKVYVAFVLIVKPL